MFEVSYDTIRLGIMQPYFFPYLGYFSLIRATNKWIVFDTAQYTDCTWMNRNRIIDPNNYGWIYFTVPVKKHHLKTPINQIEIHNQENWKEKMIAQLGYYKKYAPNYNEVVDFLENTLSHEFNLVSELNTHALQATCNYLGIDFNYEIFSEMELDVKPVYEPDEWGLNISQAMGVSDFVNPEGGQTFVNRQKYKNKEVNLKFLEFVDQTYDQKLNEFLPRLSIIDTMMFNSPEAINQMLENYKLV